MAPARCAWKSSRKMSPAPPWTWPGWGICLGWKSQHRLLPLTLPEFRALEDRSQQCCELNTLPTLLRRPAQCLGSFGDLVPLEDKLGGLNVEQRTEFVEISISVARKGYIGRNVQRSRRGFGGEGHRAS